LHDMYKRGLGDQEVVALASNESATTTTLPANVYITQAIAEEDEADENTKSIYPDQPTPPLPSEDEAAAAWKSVEAFQHEKAASAAKPHEPFRWIHFKEAHVHFRDADYVRRHEDAIVVDDADAAAPSGCLSCFRPPTLSFPSALEQRDLVRHWEEIGFQGNDPSTDLRGGGMLSLLQMLYLLDTYAELAGQLFVLSRHHEFHFPLCCVLINLSVQTLGSLRQGRLTTLCNKEKDVLAAMNKVLYAVMAVRLVVEWKAKQGVVAFPIVLKQVVDEAMGMPLRAVAESEAALALSRGCDTGEMGDQDFTDLSDK
ncbi:hypothetical protein DYB28_013451, partial [Aphanomyces astaci]